MRVRACVCDWYTCIHTYVDPSIDHRVMCKVRLTGKTHTHSLSRTHTHTRCAYIHPWSTSSRHCPHPKAGFDAIGEVLTRTECGLVACVDSIRNAERRWAQSGEEQAVLRIGFAARLCRAALPVAMRSYGLCMRVCVCVHKYTDTDAHTETQRRARARAHGTSACARTPPLLSARFLATFSAAVWCVMACCTAT